MQKKRLFGVWQPDNLVVTIALQRVEHPIPLAVRKEKTEVWKGPFGPFDGTNTVVRYDLIKGDWLPPVGKGEWPDIVFRSEVKLRGTHQDKGISRVTTFYDLVTTVEMPGEGNGLAMRMASPTAGVKLRLAPEEGYVRSQVLKTGQRRQVVGAGIYGKPYTESDENRCYFFRIRSRFDGKGRLVAGYYGKVYGDFSFKGWWTCGLQGVEFLYYLNPKPLDRNLEWDRKTNLCLNPGRIVKKMP